MKNVFIHLGVLLIIIGSSIGFADNASLSIDSYYDDIYKSNAIIKHVNVNYSTIKDKVLIVKNNIVETSKMFNVYFEEFDNKNTEIVNNIKKVEESIKEIVDPSVELNDYCQYELNDNVMNNQCDSFRINIKNMIDSYKELIKVYNDVIKSYNEFASNNGRNLVLEHEENIDTKLIEIYNTVE